MSPDDDHRRLLVRADSASERSGLWLLALGWVTLVSGIVALAPWRLAADPVAALRLTLYFLASVALLIAADAAVRAWRLHIREQLLYRELRDTRTHEQELAYLLRSTHYELTGLLVSGDEGDQAAE